MGAYKNKNYLTEKTCKQINLTRGLKRKSHSMNKSIKTFTFVLNKV